MSEKRKLSTVLFADIAGYTSLMRTDEKQAMIFLKDFKENIEKFVPLNNCEIIFILKNNYIHSECCFIVWNIFWPLTFSGKWY